MPIDKFGRELYRSYIDENVIEEKVKEVLQQKLSGLVQQIPPTYSKSTLRLWSTNRIKFIGNTIKFLLFNLLENYACPFDCKITNIATFAYNGVNFPFNIYINKNVFNDINTLVGVVLNKGDLISCDFLQGPIVHLQMMFFLELGIEIPI